MRKAVGPEIELLVDVHGTRDVSEAIELGRGLETLGVRWLEAPCQPEDIRGQAEIARALSMQVATGEWLRTVWEWRDWIALRGFDVAMPDVARTGLSEGKRIAALCDSFNLPIAPSRGRWRHPVRGRHNSLFARNPQLPDHGARPRVPRLEGDYRPAHTRSRRTAASPRPRNRAWASRVDEAAVASYSS